ncbi:GH92 family glycosyl hydrolase [Streptomyces fuscigenes]|uniref:GH92 family glycosyl hydrolase n=1 Tax=Streptomyces fuscigenes TaxID=1528880 RepID=UPI001F209585|nr:GH92 family glycosyl hydrolase [Streptomyces fuscigenes]MCF3962066.1 GH92 family glycosyl hydrolase [Streptomyces fuscigenes]
MQHPHPPGRHRRRRRALTVGLAALALVASAQGGALAASAAAGHKAETAFSSSFESGDPAPTWTDTAEQGPGGKPRVSGVDGAFTSGVAGNLNDHVTAVAASDENTQGGEVARNLTDGDSSSKWLAFTPTAWVTLDLDAPAALTGYAMTSANDHAERDPKSWMLEGSTDGKDWKTLDTQSAGSFAKRLQTESFDLDGTPAAYAHYRLEITANNGATDATQLADLQLVSGTSDTPPAPQMLTRLDKGPNASPTAKVGMGFTGKSALRYAGSQTAAGRGYSYNKIYKVDVAVRRNTQLSYEIFPAMANGDLDYQATNVAVDLAFTDGTYLSDLGAIDQNGFGLSPRGQGDSKSLYVNQWNHRVSRIGDVAAGKTVSRILVAYDAPKGPAKFQGWVDDIGLALAPPAKPKAHLADYALTTRGTNSTGSFSRGNNFPATAVPNGFNFWTPVTDASSDSWLYNYANQNNAENLPQMQAIGLSHEPSPWMGDRQTFQVMPSATAGKPDTSRAGRALPFRHDNEEARPYEYGVTFENGLKAQVAPTDHAAVMRFTFPGDDASVVFDNVSQQGGLTLDKDTGTFTGYSDVKSGLSTGATRLFVYGTFDAPVTDSSSSGVTGYMTFAPKHGHTVTLRMATSLIGIDQAKANLAQEIPAGTSYEKVRDAARAQWDKLMGRITVKGASEDQLTTLYSNMYRLYLYPNSGFENTGSKKKPVYRYASPFSAMPGPDTATHTGAKIVDGKVYVNNGFWDTYRTTWPAYSLLTPEKAGEMVDGFVQQYKDGGWTSRWSSPGYADLMTGTSSDVAFADAYVKGVKFDAEAAYDAAVKNATVVPPSSGVGRKGMTTSPFLGYTSTSTGEGFSWAMEGYVNDYGISQMGKALYAKTGKKRYKEESAYFLNRAQDFVELYDKQVGFFQGRDDKGNWHLPADQYDPRNWGGDYTESNGWGYSFTVPQDTRGLADVYGGRAGLAKKLDTFFSTPETAEFPGAYGGVIHEMTEARDTRMGELGQSNQPAHGITYMYDAAGQPYKTQAKVREVLSRLYTGSDIGQGYHGDEDNGEQSAWYIFSSLGFYPLVMGSGDYSIGSPLFTQATLHLDNGRTLTVNAPKNNSRNVYIQGVKFNGKRWDSTSLPHDLLVKGGTLDFAMGPNPSAWGSGEKDGPTSITKGDTAPQPRTDALSGAGALFDNTSATSATFTATDLPLGTTGDAVEGTQYTLTSADHTKAPDGWVLQGSTDNSHWTTVDKRSGQSFTWDKQTRPFTVAHPGAYTHYRLVADHESTLAEVELLH